jgi:hypothetical protein
LLEPSTLILKKLRNSAIACQRVSSIQNGHEGREDPRSASQRA